MNNVIELKNIEKVYNIGMPNELKVLDNIDLKIEKGEMIVIFGPSGSGKSTLLHIIGCLDRPTNGKLYIDGEDISKFSDDKLALIRRKKMGFIFQQFNLINSFTALENVELPMKIANVNKKESKKRAEELLKSVNLEKRMDHFPNQLSGGEMQRVAIARALVNDPSVILADEPTGNLDSKNGKEIVQIMCKLHKKGYTFVIVTHDPKVAICAERKISLKDGKIVGGN
jgi:putative ABC transport system ATP-binding protein